MHHDTLPSNKPGRRWGAAATFCVAAAFSWGIASQSVLAPQPAQATATLSGSTGATAAAVLVQTEFRTDIVKWPALFYAGTAAPGTPCSNIDLLPGEPVTKHIQVAGSLRRCVPLSYPPILGQSPTRPYASALIVTQPTLNGTAQAVRFVTQPTGILKWPDLWTTAQPTPAAGSPCSPVDMLAGESTTLHVQLWMAGSLWSRCVDSRLPATAN